MGDEGGMSTRKPVCFTCGSSVETAFENVLPDGDPCSTCRQRALESLPSLLPGQGKEVASVTSMEVDEPTTSMEGVESEGAQSGVRDSGLQLLRGYGDTSDDGPVRA